MAPLTSIRLPSDVSFEEARYVEIVDQLRLPHEIVWQKVSTPQEAFDAIKTMKIRGAPAIASLAALAIACDLLTHLSDSSNSQVLTNLSALQSHLTSVSDYLITSRPTAVNLREALTRIVSSASAPSSNSSSTSDVARQVVEVCKTVWSEDVARSHAIGDHGASWFLSRLSSSSNDKISLLTVCNTGSLATSGYGTALGVITSLHTQNRLAKVYFMATAPYFQGARLTSLELQSLGIPSEMVSDTAAAWLISSGKVDGFVCGADRVAANGDTANKISTYQLALLCRYAKPKGKKVPVAVAAPLTTLDLSMDDGSGIVIEQRPAWEACTVRGKIVAPTPSKSSTDANAVGMDGDDGPNAKRAKIENAEGEVVTVLVTPEGTDALNPAFDVTPAELIDGIITELGVVERSPSSTSFDLRTFVSQSQNTTSASVDDKKTLGDAAKGKTVDWAALNADRGRVAAKVANANAAFEKNTGGSLSDAHPVGNVEAEEPLRLRGGAGEETERPPANEAGDAPQSGTVGNAGGARLPLRNPDGTANLAGLAQERDRVAGKMKHNAEVYERNTGKKLGEDVGESGTAGGLGQGQGK